jgi:hypothetical protein
MIHRANSRFRKCNHMPNSLPWRFPNERDRVEEEARRFRELPPGERLERIFDLIAFGQSFLASSSNRDVVRRLRERDEEEWRRRFHELIVQYESRTRTSADRSEDGAA